MMMKLLPLLFLAARAALAAPPSDTVIIHEIYGQSTQNYPIQIGRLFAKGEIGKGKYPKAVVDGAPALTQADVKSRWSDGSVKHSLISFHIPVLKSHASATVTFEEQDTCHCSQDGSGAGLTAQQMLEDAYDFDASITLHQAGADKSRHAREMLQHGHYTRWADGPIATTVILASHAPERAYDMGWERDGVTTLTRSINGNQTTAHVADATRWVAPMDASIQQTDRNQNPVGFLPNPEHVRITHVAFDSGNSGPATLTLIRHINCDVATAFFVDSNLPGGRGARVFPERWKEPTDPKFNSFRPIFEATFWPDGGAGQKKVRVRFIGETSDTDRFQDLGYDVTLKLGYAAPAAVWMQTGLYHIAGIRWTMNRYDWSDREEGHVWKIHHPSITYPRELWIHGEPYPISIDHNAAYLGYSRAAFNYDLSKSISESTIATSWSGPAGAVRNAGWTSARISGLTSSKYRGKSPADMGNLSAQMGAGGGGTSPDATGPYPLWVTQWIYTQDIRMFLKMEGNANFAGNFPYHWREGRPGSRMDYDDAPESGTGVGKPVSLANRPKLSTALMISGTTYDRDRIVPISVSEAQYVAYQQRCCANGWDMGHNHMLEPFSALYIVTGDFYYLECMQMWTTMTAANVTPGTDYTGRGPTGAEGAMPLMINGDPDVYGWWNRDTGGVMKTRILAAALSVDGTPEKRFYDHLVNNALAGMEGAKNYSGNFKSTGTALEKSTWDWAKREQHDADLLITPATVGYPLNLYDYGNQNSAQSEYGIMRFGRAYSTRDGGTIPSPILAHASGAEVATVAPNGAPGGRVTKTTSAVSGKVIVTNATNTTPITLTAPGNTFQNGDSIFVTGFNADGGLVRGHNYGLWGIWTIANKNGDKFDLVGSKPAIGDAYRSGSIALGRTFTVANGSAVARLGLPARVYIDSEIFYVCSVVDNLVSVCPVDNNSGAWWGVTYFGAYYPLYAMARAVDFEYKADWLFAYLGQHFVDGVNSPDYNPYLFDSGRFPSVHMDGRTLISTWAQAKAGYQPLWANSDRFALGASGHYGVQLNLAIALARDLPGGDKAWDWVRQHLHPLMDPNNADALKWLLSPREEGPAGSRTHH
jgi:hypothetical protein